MKIPIFILGIVLLSGWVILYWDSIGSNISIAVAQPLQIVAIPILIPVIAVLLIREQTKGRPTII